MTIRRYPVLQLCTSGLGFGVLLYTWGVGVCGHAWRPGAGRPAPASFAVPPQSRAGRMRSGQLALLERHVGNASSPSQNRHGGGLPGQFDITGLHDLRIDNTKHRVLIVESADLHEKDSLATGHRPVLTPAVHDDPERLARTSQRLAANWLIHKDGFEVRQIELSALEVADHRNGVPAARRK